MPWSYPGDDLTNMRVNTYENISTPINPEEEFHFAFWRLRKNKELWVGNPPVSDGFPSQRASNAESCLTPGRHHEVIAVRCKINRWTNSRLSCLVHPGVRDKCRVSEIDLSQPRHETAFRWRHNGSVTSQLTDPIKWPNYPLELIGIYVHINTHNKEFLQQRCRRSKNVRLCLVYSYISIWFES